MSGEVASTFRAHEDDDAANPILPLSQCWEVRKTRNGQVTTNPCVPFEPNRNSDVATIYPEDLEGINVDGQRIYNFKGDLPPVGSSQWRERVNALLNENVPEEPAENPLRKRTRYLAAYLYSFPGIKMEEAESRAVKFALDLTTHPKFENASLAEIGRAFVGMPDIDNDSATKIGNIVKELIFGDIHSELFTTDKLERTIREDDGSTARLETCLKQLLERNRS